MRIEKKHRHLTRTLLVVSILFLCGNFTFASQRVVESQDEYSEVTIKAVRDVNGAPALLLKFEGTDGIHYYSDKETAPGGMSLTIESTLPEGCEAINPRYPKPILYYDKGLQTKLNVYSGAFNVVFSLKCDEPISGETSFTLSGLACTDKICIPFNQTSTITIDTADSKSWPLLDDVSPQQPQAELEEATEPQIKTSVATAIKYFLLAIIAGLTFNIMPCVWPVLPLAVQRLVSFSAGNRKTLLLHGWAFSGGIVLFFALFAVISVILKLTTGDALDWSEHLRYPGVIIAMGILLVVLAMFMFDVFIIGIPSSVASKSGGNGTVSGSIGMGFLAAVLSTPCSGAILAAVLVWAQTQSLAISTSAILLLGVGMMLPYIILANSPALLKKLPRPGTWMEIFRKAMGFLLLIIAVKLMLALPEKHIGGAFYYAVLACFAAWMWGGWVNITSSKKKKITVRLLAIALLVVTAPMLLNPSESTIEWQDYDRGQIDSLTEAGKPMLIKFTAKWCTNCHYLDRTVYADEDIAKVLTENGIATIKADTTSHEYPATEDLKAVYNEPGNVPVTIIIAPDGTQQKLRGVFEKKELIEMIEKLREQ